MLECLKQMHQAGCIHQDVKPDNFMISLKGNEHKVKILDMGLVMEYMRDGGHKQLARYGFQGTPHYGTMSGLRGYTLSRRDDLEMLGYSIMFLIKEDDIEWLRRDNKEAILQDKIAFAEAQSVKPYFHGIRELIKAAAATDYFVEPDYQMFHYLLVHMMDYHEEYTIINGKIQNFKPIQYCFELDQKTFLSEATKIHHSSVLKGIL